MREEELEMALSYIRDAISFIEEVPELGRPISIVLFCHPVEL